MNNIAQHILRSKRRTLALEVSRDGQLIIRAPWRIELPRIEDFVARHRAWIEKKQAAARQRPRLEPRRFVNGELFLFLGQTHALEIVGETRAPVALDGTLKIAEKHLDRAARLITDWYRHQAREVIGDRAAVYARALGLRYASIGITGARRRWGSCSGAGTLNFSWRLVMAPPAVIDYVVVHELMHLQVRNHSARFWAGVERIIPAYRQHRRWLREADHLLNI